MIKAVPPTPIFMYRNFNVSLFFAPKEQVQKSVNPVRDNGTDNENKFSQVKKSAEPFPISNGVKTAMDGSFRNFEKVSQGWPNLRVCLTNLLIISISLLCSISLSFAAQDVSNFDIDGFRLGMTVDEVKKNKPGIDIREIVLPEGGIIGYKAEVSGIIKVYFTSSDLGKVLFKVEKLETYITKPSQAQIFHKLKEKYGLPDSTGKSMMGINTCWGRCLGKFKRLHFYFKNVRMGKRPYYTHLNLHDPDLEKQNKQIYIDKYKKKK